MNNSVLEKSPNPQASETALKMPNLFVIGASKSGSSALHAYLKVHPEIAMSLEKEPCYFIDQQELTEMWPIMARRACSHNKDAYLALWKGGEQARYRGEGSVYYSQAPHKSGVPARIKAACPDARIIYTVREPVSRAVGHYWQRFKEFQEELPLERAVVENALYRDTSDYALQMEAYLEHFDRDQIFVIVAEDLRTRRRETLAEVIAWLGLDDYSFSEDEIAEVHKSPSTSRKQRHPLVSSIRNSAAWALLRKYLPSSAVSALRKSATVEFEKKSVDETQARAWLADYLAPRITAFEKLIGRDIPAWRKD
ncbi:MAG: sulfotransferase [Sulfitobacter sp.]